MAKEAPRRGPAGAPQHRWAAPLMAWYRLGGRHDLPWRRTREPWPVLVSEVMLQQTSVARVRPRWERFLGRWPSPQECAAAAVDEVLREWDGLGYPRRARALWETAGIVSRSGWPSDEASLRALPGIGPYTARALLAFSLGPVDSPVPRDVNVARVAARAALGVEAAAATPGALDAALHAGRPAAVGSRDFTFALFDLGATVCRARTAACAGCPLTACLSRGRLLAAGGVAPRSPRRQPAYEGSLRQLRGAVLRAMLAADAPEGRAELEARVASVPGSARPGALDAALDGLRRDGLLD